jgi:hypothetical protein
VIVGRGFPFFKGDGSCGTGGQAVAQAIAVILTGEPCLAVYDRDGSLMAGSGTSSAAITFFFVDVNYFANHKKSFPVNVGLMFPLIF